MTDSAGDVYVNRGHVNDGAVSRELNLLRVTAATSVTSVSVHFPSSTSFDFLVDDYSGVGAVNGSHVYSGTSSTVDATFTTTAMGAWISSFGLIEYCCTSITNEIGTSMFSSLCRQNGGGFANNNDIVNSMDNGSYAASATAETKWHSGTYTSIALAVELVRSA